MGMENLGESKKIDVKTARAELGITSESSDITHIHTEEIPRTADGKVDLNSLRDLVSKKVGSDKIEVTPEGKIVLDGEEIGEIQKDTI